MPEGMKEKEMIDLLLKRFIKDYDKTKNPESVQDMVCLPGLWG